MRSASRPSRGAGEGRGRHDEAGHQRDVRGVLCKLRHVDGDDWLDRHVGNIRIRAVATIAMTGRRSVIAAQVLSGDLRKAGSRGASRRSLGDEGRGREERKEDRAA